MDQVKRFILMGHDKLLTVASLFSGIGGFELGFERCGFRVVLQVENDKFCKCLLKKYWPSVPKTKDIRNVHAVTTEIICGGDPCQARSNAKGSRKSLHPDLAGYYLAVVGRSSPEWVVRENVRSPDVVHFKAGLEALGYRAVIVELNARDFTAQHRRRHFIVAGSIRKIARFRKIILDAQKPDGIPGTKSKKETAYSGCITAHPKRLSDDETLIYEKARGLRVLSSQEREALQGFPVGWTAGFSRSRRAIMLGNAVPPPMIEWIGKKIIEVES